MDEIELPSMRDEVLGALESLSDRYHQQAVWIEHRRPHENYDDELKLEIHILFDDIDVCVDPDRWIGDVLFADETEVFRDRGHLLDELLDDQTLISAIWPTRTGRMSSYRPPEPCPRW